MGKKDVKTTDRQMTPMEEWKEFLRKNSVENSEAYKNDPEFRKRCDEIRKLTTGFHIVVRIPVRPDTAVKKPGDDDKDRS